VERPVIVTGAAGFAGGHLLERLAQDLPAERALTGWIRPGGSGGPDRGVGRAAWQSIDLLDRPAVDAAIASATPAFVYHCAGSPHVASSWSDTLVPLESNVLATQHLLLAIERHCPDARVLIPSSALIYKPINAALTEEATVVPRTPYGVSKLAQEMLARRAGDDRGLQALIARPFNHIGPRQDASFVASAFARQIAEAEAGLVEPVIRVGNLDAHRDLTDVRDTVRAYVAIAEHGIASRVYNVCSGQAHRIGDLLDRLLSLSRVRVAVRLDPDRLRPSDTPLLLGDATRIRRELGWRAEIPIDQTLADLLADWRMRVSAGGTRA
jgi:GDP-4-dehydro-6-deoxy-D-mannose reductase